MDEKHPEPTVGVHSGIILTDNNSQADMMRSLEGEFEWSPGQSAEGPVTILASGADRIVYVYRNGIQIGRAAISIDSPQQPLGGHAFTMLEGLAETTSAFVPGRPGHRWMAVRTEGGTTLEDLGQRVHVAPAFAEKVYDIVSPGTTIVVTDALALRPLPSAHSVFLMESARK